MQSQDTMRQEVKALKAFNNVNYNAVAAYLGIKPKSFYSWLKSDYNLSDQRLRDLQKYIETFKE